MVYKAKYIKDEGVVMRDGKPLKKTNSMIISTGDIDLPREKVIEMAELEAPDGWIFQGLVD